MPGALSGGGAADWPGQKQEEQCPPWPPEKLRGAVPDPPAQYQKQSQSVVICQVRIFANLSLWVEDGTAFDATNGFLRAIEIVSVSICVVLVID